MKVFDWYKVSLYIFRVSAQCNYSEHDNVNNIDDNFIIVSKKWNVLFHGRSILYTTDHIFLSKWNFTKRESYAYLWD